MLPHEDTSMSLADMKDSDWADATIVFAACTCWSKELMTDLSKVGLLPRARKYCLMHGSDCFSTQGCERLPVGSRVVTMTQKPELDNKKWKLVKKMREWCCPPPRT